LIKNLYECNGYNAHQFITEFMNKGLTKNSYSCTVKTPYYSKDSSIR